MSVESGDLGTASPPAPPPEQTLDGLELELELGPESSRAGAGARLSPDSPSLETLASKQAKQACGGVALAN